MNYSYYIVDVFTKSAFNGAQLAIFPEAEGLDDAQMQLIAGELNLTESVFMTGAGTGETCSLKIYSPTAERDFSGHAIIGAGYVLAKYSHLDFDGEYLKARLAQNTGETDLVISRDDESEFFVQFSRSAEAVSDRFVPANAQLAEMLSLDEKEIGSARYNTMLVSCEQTYLMIPLNSFEAVRSAVFNVKNWSTAVAPVSPTNEIFLFSTRSDLTQSNFHARIVGPQIGVKEDPPIGSSMPAFAGYLSTHDHIKQGVYSYVIDRGTIETRKSVLSVELVTQQGKENEVRVGGPAVVVAQGSIAAPRK